MSETLHFAEHRLQEAALLFMGIVYCTRIAWLLHFKPSRERQAPATPGPPRTGPGVAYSLAHIAMPWAMESARTRPFFYLQFILFHLGVTAAIALSFIIPYAPGWLENGALVMVFQALIGVAFVVAVIRMIRRIADPVMRLISTPDDYFSLALLTVWFFFGFFAAPNDPSGGEGILLAFFIMTAFFLVYVPFSKISHYLYYPFTRFWLGVSMARRGVYPRQVPTRSGARGGARGT